MRVCHLRTRERNLSDVKSIPWKLVRQFLPWISSMRSFILRNDCSSSLLRSARDTSMTRPLRESLAFSRCIIWVGRDKKNNQDVLNPTERLTSVFPTFRTSNIEGAFMSYQSYVEVRNVNRLSLHSAYLCGRTGQQPSF